MKAICSHPTYLISMQGISCKMLGVCLTSWNQDESESVSHSVMSHSLQAHEL